MCEGSARDLTSNVQAAYFDFAQHEAFLQRLERRSGRYSACLTFGMTSSANMFIVSST